ncbi:TniQ family protein [Roseicyclus sp. F158]|uniref:TniQ family protein n=1 Tax=Tropicimonas omnivorans TaxID=3075590 RepID=A0ABU3DHE9_9RHOB|nr:TniQ family protein [Roseicyclus sp. F158]MDT0683121.1 TniQ family protein [Roseicyclus sp. F158]
MTLRPILPALQDESLTSYLARCAEYHTGLDVFAFISALGFSQTEIIDPAPATFDRLSELTGHSLEVLHRMVFRSVRPRVRALGQEHFHTEFTNLKQTSFCPACLLADREPTSPSRGLRVGRLSWRIEPVRRCRQHGFALVRRPLARKAERFQTMDMVAPDNAELNRLVRSADPTNPSALQSYIETRLAGGSGPAWLDGQPIDLAARTCEMLGLLLTFPVTRTMPAATSEDLEAAGAVGFEHASQGEDGVCSALQSVREQAQHEGFHGGPAQVYGFFHTWLQDTDKRKPFGPVLDVARTFILDHFPVEAGADVFGSIISRRRKHTVYTLARQMNVGPMTVQRALVYGKLLDGEPDRSSHHVVFDAISGETLFSRVHTALSNRELRKFLNCGRTQAEQLVAASFLPQVIEQEDRASNSAQHVALEDAKTFLQAIMGRTKSVERATEGMCDIPRAARSSHWSVTDIVRAPLGGKLEKVECVDPDLRFLGILLDPKEVSTVLIRESSPDLVGFEDAASILGIKRYGVRKFLDLRDRDGVPYLRVHSIQNSEGCQIDCLSRTEIAGFLREHIALADIASHMECHWRTAEARLMSAEISVELKGAGIGRSFYRRSEVKGVMPI